VVTQGAVADDDGGRADDGRRHDRGVDGVRAQREHVQAAARCPGDDRVLVRAGWQLEDDLQPRGQPDQAAAGQPLGDELGEALAAGSVAARARRTVRSYSWSARNRASVSWPIVSGEPPSTRRCATTSSRRPGGTAPHASPTPGASALLAVPA
jgi:hypothetical protein